MGQQQEATRIIENQDEWIRAQHEFVEQDRRRRAEEKSEWGDKPDNIPLFDYFARGKQELWMFDNAHRRIWRRLFAEPGIVRLNHATFPPRARALDLPQDVELYFPLLFAERFFDMEYTLHDLTLYSANAALGGEAMRQVFGMFGPAGTAKSQLVEFMAAQLAGSIVFHLKGCPLRESPLLVVPMHLRDYYSEELNVPIPKDKDICGTCRYNLRHQYEKQWENFPVEVNTISTRENRGSASVPPFDPMTQGSEVMIGEVKFWLPGDLPLHERWNLLVGAFAQSMGGILEMRELFKAVREVRNLLLIATQEQEFPAPNYQEWFSSDFMIVAHANIPEVVRWKANDENDAFFDRIFMTILRYSLSSSTIQMIHRGMLSRGRGAQEIDLTSYAYNDKERVTKALVPKPDHFIYENVEIHDAPGAHDFVAQFSVVSHLEPPSDGRKVMAWDYADLASTLSVLDGQEEAGDIQNRLSEHPKDGLHGLSPRFTIKAIERARVEALLRSDIGEVNHRESERAYPCWNIDDVRRALAVQLDGERILALEADARKDLDKINLLTNLLQGDLTDEFERRLKKRLYDDLYNYRIFNRVMNETQVINAWALGIRKYVDAIRAMAQQESSTVREESVYVMAIERCIPKFTSSMSKEWRKQVVAAWEEFHKGSYKNLRSVSSSSILGRAIAAVEEYLFKTQADELFLKVWEYMHETEKDKIEQDIMRQLPDYWCVSCLSWALRKFCSPLISVATSES